MGEKERVAGERERERERRVTSEKNRTNRSFSTNQWYWWVILPQLQET
jgi:hypothetical protein